MIKRFNIIDQIRGLAIVLMIFFHFFYDLDVFGLVDINFSKDFFWFELPRVIVFLFLFAMGLSMPLVHYPNVNWKKFWPRWIKIALGALVISIYTYIAFPKSWVYFGTLHCIATASLVSIPFMRIPKTSAAVGIILLLAKLFFGLNLPWFEMKHSSMDYIALFPWIGCVFIGFGANHLKLHEKNFIDSKYLFPLEYLGKHSLLIYIIHQPILYSIAYLIYLISK
jgi:uncharacterized membrane protein